MNSVLKVTQQSQKCLILSLVCEINHEKMPSSARNYTKKNQENILAQFWFATSELKYFDHFFL